MKSGRNELTNPRKEYEMSTSKNAVEAEPEILANEDGVVIRPALEVLSQLRRGQIMDLLSIELNRVVNGVKDCSDAKKAGTVILTLKIERVKKMINAVSIRADIKGKAPEDPPDSDLMFYDDDGNLHTRNPNQKDIFESGPESV